MSVNPNYWNGTEELRPGHIVKYKAKQDSEYYKLPPYGELLTLIAEDIQMGYNPVWICRWYDDKSRVNVVPLLVSAFERVFEPIDARTQEVADRYYQWTGKDLDLNFLQKSIDFILHPVQTEPVPNEAPISGFSEVTLLTPGGCAALSNVRFPVTLRLTASEYKLYPELEGLTIVGEILNMIPGVDKNNQCDDDKFYLFYIDEDITYKE